MSLEQRIGRRVSIRLSEPDGGYRDLLGTLLAPGKIQRRDGSIAEFDQNRIFALREVRARRYKAGTGKPFSQRVREIEEALSESWPAEEVFDRGGWRYRYSDTESLRGVSILPLGFGRFADPAQDIENEIEFAQNFYLNKGKGAAIHITLPLDRELDELLEAHNWNKSDEIEVHVADLEDLLQSEDTSFNSRETKEKVVVSRSTRPDQNWLDLQGSESIAEILKRGAGQYFSLSVLGKLVGVGRMAFSGEWALLSRIFIAEEFRGQGFAKLLMMEFAEYLNEKIIESDNEYALPSKFALQVGSDNAAAISLYNSLGFRKHHDYHYRRASALKTGGC
jgi:ribosomal protein S18 acetylase RimI-like enzyme